jgi:hypothetical protein
MLPGAWVFAPPVATRHLFEVELGRSSGSFWLRDGTAPICIFGRWPARLEDDVRRAVVLWDCRFHVGFKELDPSPYQVARLRG